MKPKRTADLSLFLTVTGLLLASLAFVSSAKAQVEDKAIYGRLAKVETEISAEYDSILRDIKATTAPEDTIDYLNRFREAQRAWVDYRDAQLLALWPYALTDTIHVGEDNITLQRECWILAKTAIDEIRLEELRAWELTWRPYDEPSTFECNEEIFGAIAKKLLNNFDRKRTNQK